MIARNPHFNLPDHRCHGSRAVDAFHTATALMELPFRSEDEDAALLTAAWTCHEHWILADGETPWGRLTAPLLLARAHLTVGRLQLGLVLARRAWRLTGHHHLGQDAAAEALTLLIHITRRLARHTETEHWLHLGTAVLAQITSSSVRRHLENAIMN